MTMTRRSLITGLISLVAAPAIVRVSSIMPVRPWHAPTIEELYNYWNPEAVLDRMFQRACRNYLEQMQTRDQLGGSFFNIDTVRINWKPKR